MYDPFKVKDAGRDQPLVCYRDGMTAEDWPAERYGFTFEAVRLFEAMPRTFTFDEVIEQGEEQGLTSSESAAAVAEWQRSVETQEGHAASAGARPLARADALGPCPRRRAGDGFP